MNTMMRVIVCGSRGWTDRSVVVEALDELLEDAREAGVTSLRIVHGAATGADAIAGRWARETSDPDVHVTEEPHPADWSMGKRAGFLRNKRMATQGAEECVAFVLPCSKPDCPDRQPHDSHGSAMMVRLCERLNIPVSVFRNGREVRA